MQKLRQIYLAIGISDCSMEEGSMRCDGNVSLRRRGSTKLGVKTELKNMNSFKNLHDGLAYEICRQAEVLEEGGQIYQETRHWDPTMKHTIVMRVKETADDYRLFPEPDLAPYDLSDEFIEGVRAKLPELPDQKAARFADEFGLSAYDARHLVDHRATADFFEACMEVAGKDAAKGYFFISPPSAHDFDTPEAKDFFSRYKAQYNSLPSSVWSVLAGDAFKVIVAALQAGTDANPEAVAKYLKKDLKEYPGLTGKLGFNEKGDRIGDLYKVYEVDGNGGFVLQK